MSEAHNGGASAAPSRGGPERYRVVVADDFEDMRILIRVLLTASGRFIVMGEGATGREAVELSAAHRPDVVLLDLAMPEMDGLEALPLILAVSPESKVVVLSD